MNLRYSVAPSLIADLGQGIGSRRWFGAVAGLLMLLLLPFGVIHAMSRLSLGSHASTGTETRFARSGLNASPARAAALAAPVGEPAPLRWDGAATLVASGSIKETLRLIGVRAGDAGQADSLIGSAIFPDRPASGTILRYRFASTAPFGERPLARLELRPRLDTKLTIVAHNNGLSIAAQAIALDATPLRIRGTVGSDLAQSALAAGLPREVVPQLVAGVSANGPAGGTLRAGDTFDLVVNFRRAVDGETRAGDLLFAAFSREAKPLVEMLRWGNEGELRTIDRADGAVATGQRWPVQARRTSGFGLRFHPILGYPRLHRGIDFGAPAGTPIHAVSDGVVSFAGRSGGHGNYVCIDHGRRVATCYAHLATIGVFAGAQLRAGATLGTVGSTGLSTGPHLHYEVYRNGRPVDPAREWIAAGGNRSSAELPESLAAGIAILKALDPAVIAAPAMRTASPGPVRSR